MTTLDDATCYRALASRDARFDGRFFAAVRTTGIYCRPVCPARKPERRNVEFHRSAAAAERAGFRPCKRCRPDAAPGSPEWRGSSAVLARALRLIHEGAWGEGGAPALAARVGVSARHLSRLFRAELGASPVAVAQTVRAHFARRLIDETDLSMTEVAFGAGYGSVRRFNAAIRERFGRAPGELRGAGARGAAARAAAPGGFVLHLPYRPPLDWEGLAAWLAPRAIEGVEAVAPVGDGGGVAYRRTVLFEGRAGWLEVRPGTAPNTLRLAASLPAGRGLAGLVARVRHLFDLSADPLAIEADLGRDPRLRRALARHPGARVPGAWDGFELAVRAILGQQVSVAGARTLLGRLVERCGAPVGADGSGDGVDAGDGGLTRLFPTPEALLEADLAGLGVPGQRLDALRALARAVVAGELDLDPAADPDETRRRLLALPGVGRWTADYVALRALGDPDAFPAGDLVLRQSAGGAQGPLAERALLERAEAWRPWRAYAAVLLWREAAGGAKTAKTTQRAQRARTKEVSR